MYGTTTRCIEIDATEYSIESIRSIGPSHAREPAYYFFIIIILCVRT